MFNTGLNADKTINYNQDYAVQLLKFVYAENTLIYQGTEYNNQTKEKNI